MKRQTLEARLRRAEGRVALAESDVFEQVKVIAELKRLGQDAEQARSWLVKLEEILTELIAHRARLKRELDSYKIQADSLPSAA